MSTPQTDTLDLVFDLQGDSLPETYHFALWQALCAQTPQLAAEDIGVLPLRLSAGVGLRLLPRRAKIALRIPAASVDVVSQLAGSTLDVAGHPIRLDHPKQRALQPYPTLHTHLAASDEDESAFVSATEAHFSALGLSANLICGIRHTQSDGVQTIRGYSLVVHDLKPDASILLQSVGMGEGKQFGCGIFMPYKVITDLE